MALVLGIIGEKGAGKGTFSDALLSSLGKKHKIAVHRFSDVLVETLRIWGIEGNRANLQTLAQVMKRFGENSLTKAVKSRALSSINDGAHVVVLDGVRWQSDFDMIRAFPEHRFVYVTATLGDRYVRTKNRKEKASEHMASPEQFNEEENSVNEVLIPVLGKKADFMLENAGTTSDTYALFTALCRELVDTKILPLLS